MKKQMKYMVGDFETTVYEGQTYTEVWASAVIELGSEDVQIHHSIRETYDYLYNLKQNICIYYHNLKFDGSFWLSFLLTDLKYEQKIYVNPKNENDVHFLKEKDLTPKSFVYSISSFSAVRLTDAVFTPVIRPAVSSIFAAHMAQVNPSRYISFFIVFSI